MQIALMFVLLQPRFLHEVCCFALVDCYGLLSIHFHRKKRGRVVLTSFVAFSLRAACCRRTLFNSPDTGCVRGDCPIIKWWILFLILWSFEFLHVGMKTIVLRIPGAEDLLESLGRRFPFVIVVLVSIVSPHRYFQFVLLCDSRSRHTARAWMMPGQR